MTLEDLAKIAEADIHYYLVDMEDPARRCCAVTLKNMEDARNDTEPPEPYSIKCFADVVGADMFTFYKEAGYKLVVKLEQEWRYYVNS